MSFARAKLSSWVGTGPDAVAERVAGRVAAHRAVRLERVERRHAEELEVVERLEVGAVDDRGALRLEPERDARAGEPRAVVGDERDVGDAPDANEPGLAAALADAVADRLENVARGRGPRSCARIVVGEGGADRDDDLGRVVTLRCAVTASATIGSRVGSPRPASSAGATTCGSDWRSAQRSPSSR